MVTGMPARASSRVATDPAGPPPATMTRSCLRFKSFSLLSTETITFVRAEEKLAPHTPDRSLPPCGGGLGRGVAAGKNVANSAHLTTPPPRRGGGGGGGRGGGSSRGEKCRQQCASHDPHPCPLPTRGRGTQEPKGKT